MFFFYLAERRESFERETGKRTSQNSQQNYTKTNYKENKAKLYQKLTIRKIRQNSN